MAEQVQRWVGRLLSRAGCSSRHQQRLCSCLPAPPLAQPPQLHRSNPELLCPCQAVISKSGGGPGDAGSQVCIQPQRVAARQLMGKVGEGCR